MTPKRILGISRSTQFSPHSEDRDAAIFAAVSSRLSRFADVSIISEDLFIAVDLSEFDLVFSMARGRDVLECLAQAEREEGLVVINSAEHLLNLSRANLALLFKQNELSVPNLMVMKPTPETKATLSFPLWIKRGDNCAQKQGDVQFVENESQFAQAMTDFANRGIQQVIVEEHLEGDLIKFYGVEGSAFFHITYPTEKGGFSKFGLEEQNGQPQHFGFDADKLKTEADRAAQLTGITVYGGDAVVTPQGSFHIIDFNDWPSFSACRKDAAKAIANRIKFFDKAFW